MQPRVDASGSCTSPLRPCRFSGPRPLAIFVFGEDRYQSSGISRWDAYRSPGGALGTLFVVTMVVLVGCGVLLGYSALRGRPRLYAAMSVVAGLAAVFLVIPTVIGFSNN
jgi:hypothetical protein